MANKKASGIHRRGFASMSPERRFEIQSRGGKAVPKDKRHFAKDPAAASKAGQWKRPEKKD